MDLKAELVQCYNKGCGQQFDPSKNTDESCRHHPGDPFFHDAYKGWSCCNKKCTDFTEFLDIKGCTLGKHSHMKPPELEKPAKNDINIEEVIKVKPLIVPALERPPFDCPLKQLSPEIAPSLKKQLETTKEKPVVIVNDSNDGEVTIGTNCKNNGCNVTYEGPSTDDTTCVHHPGFPIFHEGMKYWTCCQRKTTDFSTFLNQEGCETGKHKWIKEADKDPKCINCRWDWHQTTSDVVVTIYAKEYCPEKSYVKVNPIRMQLSILFPAQNNASFNLDLELKGVIKVEESSVSMYGTKVEVKLKKAEPGSWNKLYFPRETPQRILNKKTEDKIVAQIDAVDLDDL